MPAGITRAGDGGKLIMISRCEVPRKRKEPKLYDNIISLFV